jgi:putative oxidoreductase
MKTVMLTKISGKKASDIALLAVRVIMGIIFIAHGYQKLFQFGISGVSQFLSGLGFPLPGFFAIILSLVEFLGGIALLLGIFSRWAALLIGIVMIVAILTVKLKTGLIAQEGAGMELDLAILANMIVILVFGPGSISIELGLIKKEVS